MYLTILHTGYLFYLFTYLLYIFEISSSTDVPYVFTTAFTLHFLYIFQSIFFLTHLSSLQLQTYLQLFFYAIFLHFFFLFPFLFLIHFLYTLFLHTYNSILIYIFLPPHFYMVVFSLSLISKILYNFLTIFLLSSSGFLNVSYKLYIHY